MKILNWIKENITLCVLLLVAFIFRIYRLNYQSPWGDELFTLINSSSDKSFGEIFTVLKGDVHPPLYYYIVHYFLVIFGDSAFVARFVSVLFSIAGLVALYYLAKELFGNKKVGLIAVALLTINYFQFYYAQEARMYTMLFFTTTMSFIYLVRFIKTPNIKTALWHALFASLMINTHFFGLFALFSEYVILLFFLIKPYKSTSKNFFLYSLMSGVITIISFIPSIIIVKGMNSKTSFWIPAPERDVYTAMVKEFFGFSEICIWIAVIAIIYFFVKIFEKGEIQQYRIDPVEEKETFSFFVLFIWLLITLLTPFVLSYVKFPMIISRYFINMVPPLILIISAGIFYAKNSMVRLSLVTVFVIFSLTDVIVVRHFYNAIMKTQYREVSQYVKDHHKNNEKILSSFEYYFSYYLKKSENNFVTNSSLNQYVDRIINQHEKPESSFWYVDINNIQDPATEGTNAILDSLYVVDDNVALFDAYAKHYHDRATYKPNVNLAKFKPFKERSGDGINTIVEIFNDKGNTVEISGWAYFYDQSMQNSKIFLALINDEGETIINPESVNRGDVTTYFKSSYDLSRAGFKIDLVKANLKPGTYKLAVYITDGTTKKEGLVITDKVLTVN